MRNYLIYGAIIVMLFMTAHARGYVLSSLFHAATWEKAGQGVHK